MKKFSIIAGSIVAAAVVVFGLITALRQDASTGNYTPDDVTLEEGSFMFGDSVTLGKGDSADYVGDVSVTVTDFVYSPCPADAQCIWSGLAVIYELRVGDAVYPSSQTGVMPAEAPYLIELLDSDHQTYATLTVRQK